VYKTLALFAGVALACAAGAVKAQSVADFYRGKQITM
jgi:hypothetical protein